MPTYISCQDLHVKTFVTEGCMLVLPHIILNIFPHTMSSIFQFFVRAAFFLKLLHLDEVPNYSIR